MSVTGVSPGDFINTTKTDITLRYRNKLVNSDDSRLIKKVFVYDWAKCQEGGES